MITAEYVRDHYNYDPVTGIVTYRKNRKFVLIGSEVGTRASAGMNGNNQYIRTKCKGKVYRLHNIIFLYVEGRLPEGQIDHIDGDKLNNRWDNLREVTQSENSRNRPYSQIGISGVPGVSWNSAREEWKVSVNGNGRRIHLGYFDDFDKACEIREDAEIEHSYHENHGRAIL